MKSVAVVEDDKSAADMLAEFLRKYGQENSEEFRVVLFESAELFLSSYKAVYDIVFMDIELGGTDGMTAAGKLRELDASVMIIFVTNMAQYAVKGYEVRAFDFIVKPVSYTNFSIKLKSALESLRLKEGKILWIVNKDFKRKINSSSVRYIEVVQHMLIYHTLSGDYKASGSLNTLEKELEGESFALCNRCYFVNLKYVTAVNQFDLFLGNEKLQISRQKRSAFLISLNNFLAGGV